MTATITPELLARYDRPGPRYTSYPTAVEFVEEVGPAEYGTRLSSLRGTDTALALYVHLPFCEARCSFCGCHVVVTKRQSIADVYLDRIVSEASLVSSQLGMRPQLEQYHWGGGTPTYYSADQLEALHGALLEPFDLAPGAEVAVEVDPRITSAEQLDRLRRLGFNRVSLGVQDLDPTVQELIGRNQTWEQTRDLFAAASEQGYESINIDLIYGLPGQSEATVADTLERVLEMRPDRLAVYSFAYVPWVRPQQKRIEPELLPDRDEKFALLSRVVTALVGGGYVQIGMDHFALPDDELARALDTGTLSRNFMGYTPVQDTDVIALGTSGISDVAGTYAQNHKRLASYYQAVDGGELPVERGVVLTEDDRLRRFVITQLMCNGRVEPAPVEARYGIDFAGYFADELAELAAPGGLVEEGLVTVADGAVEATELGAPFIRNVAMVFDVYLRRKKDDGPVFSRTV